jgi:hypothetical protein
MRRPSPRWGGMMRRDVEDVMKSVWCKRSVMVTGAVWLLSGCIVQKAPVEQLSVEADPPKPIVCSPAVAGNVLVGEWLSTSRPKGIAGDFKALYAFRADGGMSYETQVKVGKRIRPGLRETGCWQVVDGVLTLQTLTSNGESIDTSDPIYQNRYRVEKTESSAFTLRELRSGGQSLTARRMKAGYKLSY